MGIPEEKGLDHTLTLMMEGYKYISNRRTRFRSDIFQTRLLGQKVICIGGEEAAEVFYDNDKFKRKGAAPKRVQKSLFGEKGIQTMDGAAHKHRKAMFMSMMTPERIDDLLEIANNQWEIAVENWQKKGRIVLFREAEKVMCRIACQWAGVPLWAKELKQRTDGLSAMIDAFGAVGTRHWQGRTARDRSEKWIRNVIRQVRNGERNPAEETALYQITWHRDLNGELLSIQMATVELLNVLRPIVAIGRFVTFGALAMHDFPETAKKLQSGDEKYTRMFVQEVRRYYPFGPFLGARVKSNFKWADHEFNRGRLVLLDVYGTLHDPELWKNPHEFKPERFEEWQASPFDFIPQGGGDYDIGHQCAGEWITVELMKVSLEFLADRIEYNVPKQDLNYSLIRMPSIPKSRFAMEHVTVK